MRANVELAIMWRLYIYNEIQLRAVHNYQHFLKCTNYTLRVSGFITNIRLLKCWTIDSASSVKSLCEGGLKSVLSVQLYVKMVINMDDFTVLSLQAAPFTVRRTPDFRNTNGMEQKTVTWLLWTVLTTPIFEYTRKNAQVVTSLQTSCYTSVHKLSASCARTACSQFVVTSLKQAVNNL
jgi:hypothetical protein